jgi:hypothetical protein
MKIISIGESFFFFFFFLLLLNFETKYDIYNSDKTVGDDKSINVFLR